MSFLTFKIEDAGNKSSTDEEICLDIKKKNEKEERTYAKKETF